MFHNLNMKNIHKKIVLPFKKYYSKRICSKWRLTPYSYFNVPEHFE